ncbi:MAG: hypothetical protein IJ202_10520 [Bacteroidales bacterium]|nr:hypothetical protein [Bacteroidales bacterium]MBQ9712433.1 hypothetical protein [Bacteroidales bacterium]
MANISRFLRTLCPVAVMALGIVACAPQYFTMNVDMRQPSVSGYDLSGKSMAVAYVSGGKDSVFTKGLAEGFAQRLEQDYFSGEEAIPLYRIDATRGASYASKDTLVNLIMDTGGDVMFLFGNTEWGDVELGSKQPSGLSVADSAYMVRGSVPYIINLHMYDSMNEADTVRTMHGNSTASYALFAGVGESDDKIASRIWDNLYDSGNSIGHRSAEKFLPTWKSENYTIYYYDSEPWDSAAQYAYEYDWSSAMKLWMSTLGTTNPEKRSCAEFNIATACYMLGDLDLALKWLDQSDKDDKKPSSATIRKRIMDRKAR